MKVKAIKIIGLFLLLIVNSDYALSNNRLNLSTNINGANGSAILFVSLGMPDNVLIAYLKKAKRYHIPIVIRGLYTSKNNNKSNRSTIGSFKDTANRVFNLIKDQSKQNSSASNIKNLMGGVSINPLLFRAFNIKVVPAMVITNSGSCLPALHQTDSHMICQSNHFDVIYGNIPIKRQLRMIYEKSKSCERSLIAREILNQYQARVL